MKKSLKRLLLIICLSFNSLLTSAYAEPEAVFASTSSLLAHSSVTTRVVTALDYSLFLNAVAVTDPHHLYHEEMGSDEKSACITRVGAPGSYRYEVIVGRENFLISDISWLSKARYCNWLQASSAGILGEINHGTAVTSTSNFNSHIEDVSETGVYDLSSIDEDATDDSLLNRGIPRNPDASYFIVDDEQSFPISNLLSPISYSIADENSGFRVAMPSALAMLTLASSSPASTSTSNFNSYIGDVSAAAALVGLLACPELMIRSGAGRAEQSAADVEIAENKVEEWSERLKNLQSQKNSGSNVSPTKPSPKKMETLAAEAATKGTDTKMVSNTTALTVDALAKRNEAQKIADEKAIRDAAEAKKREEAQAVAAATEPRAAERKANEEARAKATAEQARVKAAEEARVRAAAEEARAKATAEEARVKTAEGKESRSLNSHDLNATLAQIAQLKLDAASDAKNRDQAWSKNKSDQSISWYRAENAKRHAIEELLAAIQAEEAGNIAEGEAWRKIAEQRLLASTEFQKAAAALGREIPEREEEKSAWRRAYDHMRRAIQETRLIQIIREEEVINATHLAETEQWRAEKWREVITANEKADHYYTQAIEALDSEKVENAHDFYRSSDALDWVSDRLAKAIEARVVGTPEKLDEATRWEEAARESQKQSEYFFNAIQARAAGKTDDATSWGNAGIGASFASDRLAKAIEARVVGTQEKLDEATRWEEAARESQKRSEYYLNAIQARAAGKADDATSWTNAGAGASFASDRLAKAIEARVVGTPEKLDEATRWEEAARESQK
ncbi:MAG: hypothetical protein ACH346_03570, partial [Chthoniobacterales bacterium]